jgi:hypothetical protein
VSDTDEPSEQVVPSETSRDLREWWPVLAQLLGVAAIAVGFGVLAVWAGLVAGGVGLVAAGTVGEMGRREL